MNNYLITAKSLRCVMTQMEIRDYFRGFSKEYIEACIQTTCVDKIYNGTYSFNLQIKKNLFVNAHPPKSIEYLCQNLLLRKLNQNLLRAYRLKVVDRKKIICQIEQLFICKLPIQVMRKDVRHFFDSIQPDMVLKRLEEDGKITKQTQELCKQILAQTTAMDAPGLPRGLAISSGLTEYYMRKFDYDFQRHEGILLYCRFVDDILCICTDHVNLIELQEKFTESLTRLQLTENDKKQTTLTNGDIAGGKHFVYLGYEFKRETIRLPKNKTQVNTQICIAEEKINKLKTRIIISFKQFLKDHNERLLLDRMRYLSCITTIRSSQLKKIQIGIPVNYSAITDLDSLKKIDTFYRSLIATKKGTFGTALQTELNARPVLATKLKAINFTNSFQSKRRVKISVSNIHLISHCWK